MFLSLAKLFADAGGTREQALLVHPLQLSRWLDEAWTGARLVPELPVGTTSTKAPFLGDDAIIGALGLPQQPPPPVLLAPSGITVPDQDSWSPVTGPPGTGGIGLFWHHLVYAYLVESTGAVEIFSEVLRRLLAGETLGTLSADGARWLRSTEELFFRDPPLFSITGTVSEVRPSARTNRRNAYWRMFGLDLPHPLPAAATGAAADWKAHVGLGANTDFRAKWSELLRQTWHGLENSANTSGSNPTDPSYISFLCTALKDMLNNRRRGGLLAREEFVHVTVLSWFHLTLQEDTAIVRDLKAEATSPADRLALIAQRVGMAPAARSRELLELAEPMSSVLRAVELGMFDDPVAASALYDDGDTLGVEMRDLVNLWQSATGDRVKDRPTGTPTPVSAQPLRIPTTAAVPVAVPAPPRPQAVATPLSASNGARG
ncbi:hypothetical protein [Kineococcus indalonis]|uniref:hypothetical protein n=1 Tax=Kineococcus indalonis TaxID=2696566 RepID=UPI001413434C|nr:hypothetical protein [Kineococcus indalonis]NAZ87308.1 hypothetical protein [Kineococcus indalonis]